MGELKRLRRHGDVLLFTKDGFEIPKKVKLEAGTVIHKGANNSHVIGSGCAFMGELNDKKYLRVLKDTEVSHVGGSSTHATRPIPKGDYWVEIQRYYDHMAEEAKQVVD